MTISRQTKPNINLSEGIDDDLLLFKIAAENPHLENKTLVEQFNSLFAVDLVAIERARPDELQDERAFMRAVIIYNEIVGLKKADGTDLVGPDDLKALATNIRDRYMAPAVEVPSDVFEAVSTVNITDLTKKNVDNSIAEGMAAEFKEIFDPAFKEVENTTNLRNHSAPQSGFASESFDRSDHTTDTAEDLKKAKQKLTSPDKAASAPPPSTSSPSSSPPGSPPQGKKITEKLSALLSKKK